MRLSVLLLSLLAAPAAAHEFWVEPEGYEIPADGMLVADLVNGEDFQGQTLPYLPRSFRHFVITGAGGLTKVAGRTGDIPAVNVTPPAEGLNVIVFASADSTVTYKDWETFLRFIAHKDLGDAAERHDARGLSREDVKEVYSRYSKALVAVGDGAGADSRTGLETELVALTNPYTDDVSGGMRLQLFYGSEVRADAQVEIYERPLKSEDLEELNVFTVRTDAEGVATVPVKPGFEYMADAVVLREPDPAKAEATGAVWESVWANLVWSVPAE